MVFWKVIEYKSIPYIKSSHTMFIVMFLLYLNLVSYSFYLLFMFLLLHIYLVPGFSLLRWYLLISISFFFFFFSSCFSCLGNSWKNAISRLSPNHLTFLSHLLKHDSYYLSALCCASTLKLDWWEHAWGNERQLFLLCSPHGEFFPPRNSFYKDIFQAF